MNLKLLRVKKYENRTQGQLYIDNEFFCFTLEDVDREIPGVPVEQWKIKGETCIPKGTYKVTLETSNRFGVNTPTINDVPGFTFIRIHSGNTEAHTEGCPLVGYKINSVGIILPGTTRPAFKDLQEKLKGQKEIWITVEDL